MTVSLIKRIVEAPETRPAYTEYRTEYEDLGLFVFVSADGSTEIAIAPRHYMSLRMRLLQFHPKNVAELEDMADRLPGALRALADAMRTEGLEDLRGKSEKALEERLAKYDVKGGV